MIEYSAASRGIPMPQTVAAYFEIGNTCIMINGYLTEKELFRVVDGLAE